MSKMFSHPVTHTTLTRTLRFLSLIVLVIVAYPRASHAQQAIETETARPLGNGVVELGAAYEFQRSTGGLEHALPFAFELGIGDRFELLVEPVAVTAIRPSAGNGPNATGVGDLEITGFGLIAHETPYTPAISLGVELKLPTARNNQIGTLKTDIAGYVIGSKLIGPVDVHVNLGYTVIGQPMGVTANNIFSFAVAGVLPLDEHHEAFAECYGNTAASPDGESGDAGGVVLVPELAAGEVVGSGGVAWKPTQHIEFSLGASYDTNKAFQLRTGFVFRGRVF